MRLSTVYPRLLLTVGLTVASIMAGSAAAHTPSPAHHCEGPSRPADDQNDALWQRYLADVDAFRACISDFVDANQAEARAHSEAARQATADWNGFVRSELNVPEDYPWPPE